MDNAKYSLLIFSPDLQLSLLQEICQYVQSGRKVYMLTFDDPKLLLENPVFQEAHQKELLNRHLNLNIPFPNCITRNIGRTLKKQVTFLAADGDGIAVTLTASFGSGGLTAADNFVDYKVSTIRPFNDPRTHYAIRLNNAMQF